ncbi:MAG: hypothetical protein Q9197_000450 [Variospora fuerteventurae]
MADIVPPVPVGPAVVELGKPYGAEVVVRPELLEKPVGPTIPVPKELEEVEASVGPAKPPEDPVPDDPVAETIPGNMMD